MPAETEYLQIAGAKCYDAPTGPLGSFCLDRTSQHCGMPALVEIASGALTQGTAASVTAHYRCLIGPR